MFQKLLLYMAFLGMLATADAQNFFHTCTITQFLQGRLVYARCKTGKFSQGPILPGVEPVTKYTLLDVGFCYANSDGRLVRRDEYAPPVSPFPPKRLWDDYAAVADMKTLAVIIGGCRDCGLEPRSAWLNCDCKNKAGRYARTRIDMNNHISNWAGNMCCGSGRCSEPVIDISSLGAPGPGDGDELGTEHLDFPDDGVEANGTETESDGNGDDSERNDWEVPEDEFEDDGIETDAV